MIEDGEDSLWEEKKAMDVSQENLKGGSWLGVGACTCGWMLTVMGEMLLLKPGTDGAIGLARCRNSSESIAMLKVVVGWR